MAKKAHKGFKKVKQKKPKQYTKQKAKAGDTTIKEIGDLASKAWSGIQYVKNLINCESNYLTASGNISNTAFISSPLCVCITLCATGDGIGARTGNSIRPQHLEFRSSISSPAGVPVQWRFILFRDKQGELAGTLPVYTDLLVSGAIMSGYNHDNLGRYTILMDKIGMLNPANTTNVQHTMIDYDADISGHVTYDNTSSAQSSAKTGHIYYMFLSDKGSGSGPTADFFWKLMFTDN